MADPFHPQPSGKGVDLEVALSVIPSLPRRLLARLVQRAIERLDEIDGDADDEDGESSARSFVDERGRYFGPILPGMIGMEDDEEGGDLEGIDEREPELWEGGGGDVPPWSVPQGTSLNR